MSALTAILIGAATKVGATVVKDILEKHVGGAAGEIGGTVIDTIAAKVGVEPESLPGVPAPEIEEAVAEVEAEAPSLVLAYLDRQRETNRLLLAEMAAAKENGSPWTWTWRPAGMWLMLVCIGWFAIVRPLLNAVLAASGAGIAIEIGLDFANFMGVFTVYTGLYMGGNTLLRTIKK